MKLCFAARRPAAVAPSQAQRLGRITGLFWIATFVTSIPAVLLYDPLLNDRDFILGAGGGDARIFIGATLELLLIIANIGTAVVPFTLFKRYNDHVPLRSGATTDGAVRTRRRWRSCACRESPSCPAPSTRGARRKASPRSPSTAKEGATLP